MTAERLVEMARERAEKMCPQESLLPLYTRIAVARAEAALDRARAIAEAIEGKAA